MFHIYIYFPGLFRNIELSISQLSSSGNYIIYIYKTIKRDVAVFILIL